MWCEEIFSYVFRRFHDDMIKNHHVATEQPSLTSQSHDVSMQIKIVNHLQFLLFTVLCPFYCLIAIFAEE